MDLGLRVELIGDWIRSQRFYIRIPIALALLGLIALFIYFAGTRPLGYSYGETAFWFIVFALAADRVRLIVEDHRRN